ncbi:MAG: VanW family protein [Caldilinea sp.]
MRSTTLAPAQTPIRRTALDMLALSLLLLTSALFLLLAGWGLFHTYRIYPGIHIDGVAVGGLTRSEAYRLLTESRLPFPLPPITLEHAGQLWTLPTSQLSAQPDFLETVNRAYLYGRSGLPLPDLSAQLTAGWRGVHFASQLSLPPEALTSALSAVAAQVERPGSAERRIGGRVVAAQPGLAVDIPATVEQLRQQLATALPQGTLQVPMVVRPTAPPEAAIPQTHTEPLLLRLSNLQLSLAPAEVERLTRAPAALRSYLEGLAAQIDQRPRDARLRFNPATGAVTVLSPSRPGRALDIEASLRAFTEAATRQASGVELPVTPLAPAVDMNRIAEMGLRELVVSSQSSFAGSSASRLRNVEVAAQQFEGVVLPPGETFSFNEIVRDVSSANGFEDSLIIWGDRTAVGVGGGVCQVSTTLFRAAYEGGFPIVERYNHGYIVDWYGEPGLDATIFTPTVDFRFRNDTDAYLLIDPEVDSANGILVVNFYGTRPARTVTIGAAQITDRIEPEAPLYTVDETLEPGQSQQVEWQKAGMTVVITRTIVENDIPRTDTLRSQYQPWRAVYLVGPGTPIPTPEPNEEAP